MNSKRKVFSLLLILLLSISTLSLPVAAEAKPPSDDVIIYTSDPTEPPPTTAPSTKPTTAATKPTEATAPAATAPTTPPTIPTISEPFEQGNAIASSLQYHKDTNKQFLTIETRSGEVFYIIIDYDAPVNENLEQFSA